MKFLKKILWILCFINISFAANMLDLEEITQQENQWCWAGCSYTILTFYGENVTQPIIVQYAYGDSSINQWNWLSGHYDVEYNGVIYNPHGINEILDHWNTPNAYGYYSLSESAWKTEINDGHPFVIRWGWNSGGGHFVVGQGYLDNGNYQIMDPWYGCGYTINTYNWMMTAKNQGNWTHSLTTDRSAVVNKYSLTIENGSGSGSYAEGSSVNIEANTPQAGYAFNKWTGSTSYLSDVNSSTATVTMPAANITLTATYIDTTTPIDTSNPSENLVLIAGWEDSKDEYGSSLIMDTSKAESDTIITGDYGIGSSDTTNEEWPWASITGYTGNDFGGVTAVKVTYKSNNPVNLVLEEPVLSDSGYAFFYELELTTNYKTVYIPITAFKQPDYTSVQLKKSEPQLDTINAISFTSDLYGTNTSIELTDLVLFNYKGDPVNIMMTKSLNNQNRINIINNRISIDTKGLSDAHLAIYTLSGKKIYDRFIDAQKLKHTISINEIGNQPVILKLKSKEFSSKKVFHFCK